MIGRLDAEQFLSDKTDTIDSYCQIKHIQKELKEPSSGQPRFLMNLGNHSQDAAESLIRNTSAVEGCHLEVTEFCQ